MWLHYAQGGGLGHLTRAVTFWQQQQLPPDDICLMSASPYARAPYIPDNIRLLNVPQSLAYRPEQYRQWLVEAMDRMAIHTLCIDAFPWGLMGEWAGLSQWLPQVKVVHLARRLRWEAYTRALPPAADLMLDTTWLLEPLEAAHEEWLRAHSRHCIPFDLHYPVPDVLPPNIAQELEELPHNAPLWLIVHSTPADEVALLCQYATQMAQEENQQPVLRIVSTELLPSALPPAWDCYPASALFARADRIFTGGGFNSMRQMAPYRDKHYALPFPRRYDDQHWRVAHYLPFRPKSTLEPPEADVYL